MTTKLIEASADARVRHGVAIAALADLLVEPLPLPAVCRWHTDLTSQGEAATIAGQVFMPGASAEEIRGELVVLAQAVGGRLVECQVGSSRRVSVVWTHRGVLVEVWSFVRLVVVDEVVTDFGRAAVAAELGGAA